MDLDVDDIRIDSTRGSEPLPERDLTGRELLVTVKNDLSPEERLPLIMKVGNSVKGENFIVSVLDIQKPRYIKMPGGHRD